MRSGVAGGVFAGICELKYSKPRATAFSGARNVIPLVLADWAIWLQVFSHEHDAASMEGAGRGRTRPGGSSFEAVLRARR